MTSGVADGMTHKTQITAGLFSTMMDKIQNTSMREAVGMYTECIPLCVKQKEEEWWCYDVAREELLEAAEGQFWDADPPR